MQNKLLLWTLTLIFAGLMSGCETKQVESNTVRTPMAVPEESEQTGSPAEVAKQQAAQSAEPEVDPALKPIVVVAPSAMPSSQPTEEAAPSQPVSYWDEKPAGAETAPAVSESESGMEEQALDNALTLDDPAAGEPPAPAPETSVATITLNADDNEGSCTIETNSILLIELEGNPTTGYTWSVESYDNSVLSLDGNEYMPSQKGMVGGGGSFSFKFKAISAGTTTLKLVYARPWEKDVPPVKIFTNEVSVQ